MTDGKGSEQKKEEHIDIKTKSYPPRRMNTDVERLFQESPQKIP